MEVTEAEASLPPLFRADEPAFVTVAPVGDDDDDGVVTEDDVMNGSVDPGRQPPDPCNITDLGRRWKRTRFRRAPLSVRPLDLLDVDDRPVIFLHLKANLAHASV